MRKTLAILLVLQGLFSSPVMADFLGLYVGGGNWKHDPSGDFSSTNAGSNTIDLESSLNFSSESDTYFWAAFDHPVPLIPNIRLEMTSLSHQGTTSASLNFLGSSATGPSKIALDSTDIILYYRLLDNWVNLDLGLNMRKIEGEFRIDDQLQDFSETIPMLYLAAQLDLPFSGFSVGADYSLVSYDGSNYDDIRLRAIYEMGVIGFEAGLRTTLIKLDDVDNINADLEFSGLMLGMFLHF